jgi:uncharacterized protein (TIGR02453 family)
VTGVAFKGWPSEALDFFEQLEADNSKPFWTAHKSVYEQAVLQPMSELLAELAPRFGESKIFRPYRDVRFSADKSPYKTNIAANLGNVGYISLSADGLGVGSGMYMMMPDQLERYRAAVAADGPGKKLERIIATGAKAGIEIRGHEALKTAPKGYPKDHPRIELLRNKGLIAWQQWPPAAWLGTAAARKRVVDFLVAARPLNGWLDANVGASTA